MATLAGGVGVARVDGAERYEIRAARRVAVVPKVPPRAAPVADARPAPRDLPTIDYWGAPGGFPKDAAPESVTPISEDLRPLRKLAVYDAPGGRPRAFLPRSFSGLTVTVPIVERRPGWAGVLLPSLNRRVGWIPEKAPAPERGPNLGRDRKVQPSGAADSRAAENAQPLAGGVRGGVRGKAAGWEVLPLRDQLVLHRRGHRLVWLRDGRLRGEWKVAVGASRTPTPLGRTFVLGRTITVGGVYAGLDALVLGAVPDNREALAPALRDGHTGIHAWSRRSAFGRSVSNGCVRLPADAQRVLLRHLGPGTPVHVID
ncbi:L,D-transpeptidase [Actinoplanes sp. NPDC000266]